MVRCVCLKMHSGCSMGKDLEERMVEVERPVLMWTPLLWRRQRENPALGFPPSVHPSWKSAGISIFILLGGGLSLQLPRLRTPESLFSSTTQPGSKCVHSDHLTSLEGSQQRPHAPFPGPQQVYPAQRCFQGPSSLLCKHLTSEIPCSWVTCNGGFTFLAHFRVWRSTHRPMNRGRGKKGIPLSSLGTENVVLLTSVWPQEARPSPFTLPVPVSPSSPRSFGDSALLSSPQASFPPPQHSFSPKLVS